MLRNTINGYKEHKVPIIWRNCDFYLISLPFSLSFDNVQLSVKAYSKNTHTIAAYTCDFVRFSICFLSITVLICIDDIPLVIDHINKIKTKETSFAMQRLRSVRLLGLNLPLWVGNTVAMHSHLVLSTISYTITYSKVIYHLLWNRFSVDSNWSTESL